MEERYVVTADLGTSKIAVCVARMSGPDTEVLYYKEVESAGIRHGAIFNPSKAAEALRKAIADAEGELGIKITQLVAGLPRAGVRQEIGVGRNDRNDPSSCITQEEIDDIKNFALDSYPLEDKERFTIYGGSAQSFSVDDMMNCTEDDVVGMPSSTIEGNFRVYVGRKAAKDNIDYMLNILGIAPARYYFLPDSTADAVLTAEEKDNGTALIEMGAGVTSLTIFQGGILRYYASIPFGGRNITDDIKYECGFTDSLAENIKLGYGACMPEKLLSMSDKILRINDNESGNYQDLPVKYLSEVITCRVREIVDAILFKIQDSGFADRMRGGVVLTGGCANLTNCANLIKEMSGYNVRVGFPKLRTIIASDCPGIGEAGAASTVGMILKASKDSHLNCTGEYKPVRKASPVSEVEKELHTVSGSHAAASVIEDEPETAFPQGNDGTLFGPAPEKAGESKKPENKRHDTKAPQPTKPAKALTWFKKFVGAIEDSAISDNFDKMIDNL